MLPMKPPVETVRISQQGRDQLIKLKRHTGIEHWNTLCRWALCVSLREPTEPGPAVQEGGGVEIPWRIFGGEMADTLAAAFTWRAVKGEIPNVADRRSKYFRDHLHRGLGYLASGKETRNIESLFERWLRCPVDSK